MVKRSETLNLIFASLADPTRRDMLERVAKREYSVGELVQEYDISFAAVSKHLKVLEGARLISKRKEGKRHIVTISPSALQTADTYLEKYRQLWQGRYNKLETLLKKGA